MQKLAWLKKHKWSIGVGTVGAGFIMGMIALLIYQPSWSGFGPDFTTNTERDSRGKVIKTVKVEQSGKTPWDLLSVLGVPLSLTGLGLWFQYKQQQQSDVQARLEKQRIEEQARLEKEQAELEKKRIEQKEKLEKDISESNQREEALRDYIDKVSDILLDKKLFALDRNNPQEKAIQDSALHAIRARTLSILRSLEGDGKRKASVLLFLHDAKLITNPALRVVLHYADFSGAELSGAFLTHAILDGVILNNANLKRTKLIGANLRDAQLHDADLTNANLGGAVLASTEFLGAKLSGITILGDKLQKEATLGEAKLCSTELPDGWNLDPNRDCKEIEAVRLGNS